MSNLNKKKQERNHAALTGSNAQSHNVFYTQMRTHTACSLHADWPAYKRAGGTTPAVQATPGHHRQVRVDHPAPTPPQASPRRTHSTQVFINNNQQLPTDAYGRHIASTG